MADHKAEQKGADTARSEARGLKRVMKVGFCGLRRRMGKHETGYARVEREPACAHSSPAGDLVRACRAVPATRPAGALVLAACGLASITATNDASRPEADRSREGASRRSQMSQLP